MFGLGKRKEPVKLEEVLQQDEGTMEDAWDVVWETVCVWCLAEQGIIPNPADSHGICAYHRVHVLQSYREGKTHQYS